MEDDFLEGYSLPLSHSDLEELNERKNYKDDYEHYSKMTELDVLKEWLRDYVATTRIILDECTTFEEYKTQLLKYQNMLDDIDFGMDKNKYTHRLNLVEHPEYKTQSKEFDDYISLPRAMPVGRPNAYTSYQPSARRGGGKKSHKSCKLKNCVKRKSLKHYLRLARQK